MFLKKFLGICSLLFAIPAWSLVEIKMTYTGLQSDFDKDKVYSGSGTVPTATAMGGMGGDLIFTLPILGLGLGVRYENLGLNFSGNGIKFDASATRTSGVLGWRWIDTLVYFGPIFTVGASHSGGKIKVTQNTNTISDLTADSQTSYSAGLELGAKLLGFRIGAEAGMMNYIWKDLSGTTGTIKTVGKLDMSGTYVKIAIGFGI